MKVQVVFLSIIFVFMSINPAVAGRRHGHHNSHHYGGHGHHNSHYSYGHYDHHDSHGYNLAYGLGGLIVGGIIGATLTNAYNNQPRDYRPSNYVNPYPVNNAIKPSYMLQPNGACYLISHVSNGNMVLSPASSRNCQ